MKCTACGGTVFASRPILWDELVTAWELTPEERDYVDRQQGTHCTACGSNLRSCVLAEALLAATGGQTLSEFVDNPAAASIEILEVNEAGSLNQFLSRLPHHRLARFPEVDMQAMPYADATFDIVLHSDTLEHIPDPLRALSECYRVLRDGGAVCFTVPIIVGRMTRSCAGRTPSFHGFPGRGEEDLRVQTEFGADTWTYVMRAGFTSVTMTTMEFPAAIAVTAWKARPAPLISVEAAELKTLRAELTAMRTSRSWRVTRGLRRAAMTLRRQLGPRD